MYCCHIPQGLLTPTVEWVTPDINLAESGGRAKLVLVLSKLYVLLVKMAAAVPSRPGRHPAFHKIQRNNNTIVEIMSNHVVKHIPEFADFLQRHKTSFDSIQAAYEAAKEEFVEALTSQRNPVLIRAIEPLSVKKGKYKAVTGPLGYKSSPAHEQVCT
jgi:hypothetical protein